VDSLFPKFVLPAPDVVWRPRIEDGAGVYMLGTAIHFVTPGSTAELEVTEAGAVRVGTLRFDADPTERSHRNRPVLPVAAAIALRRLDVASGRN
jgi:hypothetical protein